MNQAIPTERPRLDARVRFTAGEISDKDALRRPLANRADIGVYHLASVVSGGGERDFDLAMRVNLTAHIDLLEACPRAGFKAAQVFASSIAVFGGDFAMPRIVGDDTKQTPQTTYGSDQGDSELLINDYSRKGFIDGRAAGCRR